MPVFTALIATFALGERFGRWGWVGTAVSFGGVALIAVASDSGFKLDPNAVLILGAALCSAIASVLQKPLLGRLPALAVTAWILLIGSVPLFPAVPATIQALAAAPAEVNWGVAYLVIFPTAIGYLTWAIALKRLTAARASNFLYGVPPVATLIGFVWLGETPTALGAVGGVMAPHRFVLERRIERARLYLADGKETLANIAYATGFSSQAHFSSVFRRLMGATPKEYQRSVRL